MIELSLEQRKDWWMTLYAIQSFTLCLQACECLLELRAESNPLYPSLVISTHGFYGRPFKAQRGVSTSRKGIDENLIPPAFSGMHGFLINFRDKVLLHNDADDLPALAEPINLVRVSVTSLCSAFHSAFPFSPIETYRAVPNLLKVLIEHFNSEHERMLQTFSSLLPKTPGEYFLNVKEGPSFLPWKGIPETILFKGGKIT